MTDPWKIFDYEADMFGETRLLLCSSRVLDYEITVRNAIIESHLLHTRILVNILLSRGYSSDIKLSDLVKVFELPTIEELKVAYGKHDDANSPCWMLNKMLAHPSKLRLESYDYRLVIEGLGGPIFAVLDQIKIERVKMSRP